MSTIVDRSRNTDSVPSHWHEGLTPVSETLRINIRASKVLVLVLPTRTPRTIKSEKKENKKLGWLFIYVQRVYLKLYSWNKNHLHLVLTSDPGTGLPEGL